MKLKSKICGVSDTKILNYLVNHINPPEFIGFIVNYPKSNRFVEKNKIKELLSVNKKKSFYVAVLVNPDHVILEEIKNLPFDYYQLYNCNVEEIKTIKQKYKKKIIVALTIKDQKDVQQYKIYKDVADILLFDSIGYEKSMSFNHNLVKDIQFNKETMIAGNIKIDDNLEKYKEIADIVDISGGLETSGLKDISKIEIFLNNVKKLNNEA